ncbi:MAG: Acetyl-coenzyme A synthetase [Phycisphaerae bacterium]|nr:Acetyl-coenzyme A synthetase [Phycisphaerae bacterium]
MTESAGIQSVLKESRVFPPQETFARQAHLRGLDEYRRQHARSLADPEGFWAEAAADLHWFRRWERVVDWKLPDAKWFVGGKTNVSYNCLDLQIERGRGDHTAILWEGEPGEIRRLTFSDLRREVCRFANGLRKLGVRSGDRVTLYMPMIPELAVAMLACARIGAPHSVIFGGFSSQAIVDRVIDAESHTIVTADGGYRRGAVVPLKANVDDACAKTDLVKRVIVFRRTGQAVPMQPGRDVAWDELVKDVPDECPAEPLDSEHMLYLLYTSGSTGKPKGIHHTTAGYMVYTRLSARYVFDLKPDDVYWCTADIGWVTGHSYVVYGILANGVTTLMYEGAPNHPAWDRFWDIIERHKVTKFYTAPTALRAFMRQGEEHPNKHDLSSLKLLGTVGEPINPEAWMWYHRVIGKERCPIVDTWWQTETGGILITPLPGVTPTKPGSATLPFFGVEPDIVDKSGTSQPANVGGFLVIRKPWPAMLRGIYGDRDRYVRQYWSEVPGVYFAGDSARRDEDGYFWIMGRIDDVIKVAGHRLGTAEVESALVSHPKVAEAAVVGIPHDIKGQAIAAFVTLRLGSTPTDALKKELVEHVGHTLGALAKPEQIRFTDALPKTRSGKIMRRLLVEIATKGEVKGDTTTLEDFGILAKLAAKDED